MMFMKGSEGGRGLFRIETEGTTTDLRITSNPGEMQTVYFRDTNMEHHCVSRDVSQYNDYTVDWILTHITSIPGRGRNCCVKLNTPSGMVLNTRKAKGVDLLYEHIQYHVHAPVALPPGKNFPDLLSRRAVGCGSLIHTAAKRKTFAFDRNDIP
jgi:hypothetical protein